MIKIGGTLRMQQGGSWKGASSNGQRREFDGERSSGPLLAMLRGFCNGDDDIPQRNPPTFDKPRLVVS